jgi:hypothetical protein
MQINSRREMLRRCGAGFGSIGLCSASIASQAIAGSSNQAMIAGDGLHHPTWTRLIQNLP